MTFLEKAWFNLNDASFLILKMSFCFEKSFDLLWTLMWVQIDREKGVPLPCASSSSKLHDFLRYNVDWLAYHSQYKCKAGPVLNNSKAVFYLTWVLGEYLLGIVFMLCGLHAIELTTNLFSNSLERSSFGQGFATHISSRAENRPYRKCLDLHWSTLRAGFLDD